MDHCLFLFCKGTKSKQAWKVVKPHEGHTHIYSFEEESSQEDKYKMVHFEELHMDYRINNISDGCWLDQCTWGPTTLSLEEKGKKSCMASLFKEI